MNLLKIKWENITTIVLAVFFINCIVSHKIEEPSVVMFEVMFYSLGLAIVYISISGFRKDMKKEKDIC